MPKMPKIKTSRVTSGLERDGYAGMSPPSYKTQRLAVILAFVSAALSLSAAVMVYIKQGELAGLPVFGGVFMLTLAVTGFLKLTEPRE
jgi:hypothetical protein